MQANYSASSVNLFGIKGVWQWQIWPQANPCGHYIDFLIMAHQYISIAVEWYYYMHIIPQCYYEMTDIFIKNNIVKLLLSKLG